MTTRIFDDPERQELSLDETLLAGGCGWLLGKDYVCEPEVCRVIANGLTAMECSSDLKVTILCREANGWWYDGKLIVDDNGHLVSEDDLDPAEVFPDGDPGKYICDFEKRAYGPLKRAAPFTTARRLQVVAIGLQFYRFHRGMPLLRWP